MILNPEAFEFVTDRGVTLPFEGALLGGSDSVEHRVTEHLLLNQSGAIHQAQGQGPRRFTFRVLLRGPNAKSDYRTLEAAVAEQPFGTLIHPWFGSLAAVFRSLSQSYDFDAATNTLECEVNFTETTIRKLAPTTPSGGMAAAARHAAALAALPRVVASPSMAAKAATVVSAVKAMQALIVSDTSLTLQPLRVALSRVSQSVDAILATSGGSANRNGWVDDAARMTFATALSAYKAAAASRPPIVEYRTEGVIALTRLVAQLYGGGSAAMVDEILALNRVRPLAIPPGTRLLIPDPAFVRRTLLQ